MSMTERGARGGGGLVVVVDDGGGGGGVGGGGGGGGGGGKCGLGVVSPPLRRTVAAAPTAVDVAKS